MSETLEALESGAPDRRPKNDVPTATAPGPARRGWLGRVARAVPNLLILAALAGLGYWGHHTGWTMPTLAALTGQEQAQPADWCDEHNVPASECIECNPDLLPSDKDYGWCKEHGVHQCPLCHPEVAQPVAQLPSPPEVTSADRERVRKALALKKRPENNHLCQLYRRRIQFASAEAVKKAGVVTDVAARRRVVEGVSAPGEIRYDPTRLARLSSRLPGTVCRVTRQVGDPVKRGEILAVVDAAEVGKAKADRLQALAEADLKRKVAERLRRLSGAAIAEAQVQEAETALRAAEIRIVSAEQALANLGLPIQAAEIKNLSPGEAARRLRLLGLTEDLAKSLGEHADSSNLLPVKAPMDGVVVERQVAAGEVVDATDVLFVVADTRQMWLTLDVRQEDVRYVQKGLPVRFRADDSGEEVSGSVSWVSTTADEKTRTVQVRADLRNPDGRLRASTFGTGQIILREEPTAIVVPSEAVQWDGSCHVVFVRDRRFFDKKDPKFFFHTRTVRPGVRDSKYTEIIVGVLPGEAVAAKGSGVLRSQLLKNNLGAG
jgi:cobalt-zinc-cadmium efflux system membrane fusion protein